MECNKSNEDIRLKELTKRRYFEKDYSEFRFSNIEVCEESNDVTTSAVNNDLNEELDDHLNDNVSLIAYDINNNNNANRNLNEANDNSDSNIW